MRDIKDISISSCFHLYWDKDRIDVSKLVYVGKKRVRHRYAGKIHYEDEYVYWYPENVYGGSLKPIEEGEYYRSPVLLEELLGD